MDFLSILANVAASYYFVATLFILFAYVLAEVAE